MKKTVLLFIVLFGLLPGIAGGFAADAGSWALAGDLSAEKGFGAAWDSSRIAVAPGIQYFLFDGFALGAELWFERHVVNGNRLDRGGAYGGFVWYFRAPLSMIFPYAGAAVGGGRFAWDGLSAGYFGARFDAGMVFLFNESIGARIFASYFRDSVDNGGAIKAGGRLLFGAGVSLFLF